MKCFLFPAVIFLALFTGCSSHQVQNFNEEGSLKIAAENFDSKTNWTSQLEELRLGENIPEPDGVATQDVTAQMIFASGKESLYPEIYPELPGFSLLDTSALDEASRSCVEGFANALIASENAENFIAEDKMYTLVIFYEDTGLKSSSKNKFEKYILGQPFLTEEVFECPVRFIKADKTYIDVNLYLENKNSTCKINQISIR